MMDDQINIAMDEVMNIDVTSIKTEHISDRNYHQNVHTTEATCEASVFSAEANSSSAYGYNHICKSEELGHDTCSILMSVKEECIDSDVPTTSQLKTKEEPGNVTEDVSSNTLDIKPETVMHIVRSNTYSGKLQTHMVHAGEEQYSDNFNTTSHLKRHMLTHTDGNPYSCSKCDKSFNQNRDLKSHMLTHARENQYSCFLCHKSFSNISHLKTHIITHAIERPYSCTQCDKSYKHAKSLKKHVIIHTREYPFSCSQSAKSFPPAGDLQRHMTKTMQSGQWCAAPHCHNNRGKCPKLSFFRFPKDKKRFDQWVQNSNRVDLKGNTRCVLCANHFDATFQQFMNPLTKDKMAPNSVPTLFDDPNPATRVSSTRSATRKRSSDVPTPDHHSKLATSTSTV